MKREGELKSAAMAELKLQCPRFIVLLLATAGGPDRAIAGAGKTTYWEMKHATPDFVSHGNQALCCMRLNANAGYCRYVLWQEDAHGRNKRTLIVHPREVHVRVGWQLVAEASCVGYDHRWLVRQIRRAHGV